MLSKVLQMIKQAYVSLVTDDSTANPRGQATYNGKTTDFLRFSPYGLNSNPPLNSWALLLSSQGQEAVKIGLVADFLNRKKNLLEGEVTLYNTVTQSYVFLKANGDIEVDAKNDLIAAAVGDLTATVGGATTLTSTGNVSITAPIITLNGTVVINGPLTGLAAGPVLMPSDATISTKPFTTHVHTLVTTGLVNSGPVG